MVKKYSIQNEKIKKLTNVLKRFDIVIVPVADFEKLLTNCEISSKPGSPRPNGAA